MNPEAFQDSSAGRVLHVARGDYWAYVPHPLPPKLQWTSELVNDLSQADRTLGELAGLGRSLLNPHLLIRPFVRREAVLSSRIEGTRASLSDLYAYEADQLTPLEPASDVREVHNYVRALEYGLERLRTLPLSLRLTRQIHAWLMEGVRGERQTPGEFRRSQNWLGPPGCTLNDAPFVPPPVPEMRETLAAFEEFLHAPPSLPPLVRLGLIHYQFEVIHPFLDGNGRVGRLLITLLLCAWDLLPQPLLYLSAYFEAHRQGYYDHLLAVSQRGAWEAWLQFFLRGVAEQSSDAMLRAGRLQTLRQQYRERFQGTRATARLLNVVDLLFVRPILGISHVAESLGVSYQSASRYVEALQAAGLLREISGRARNRMYRADEVLRAIEEPLNPAADVLSGEL
ncbi:MAG: Fic family protein [Chloroflexi bacterium]|nr:Fic family protein [Chloroflexota bacterium]